MNRCRSCGGRYEPRTPTGEAYYHVCPPVTLVTVSRAGSDVEVPLARVQDADLRYVLRDGVEQAVAHGDLRPTDLHVRRREIQRPNERDENIRVIGVDENGRAITPTRADGDGAERV